MGTDEQLDKYKEDITVLLSFFLGSSSTALFFYVSYKGLSPSNETLEKIKHGEVTTAEHYRILQRVDTATIMLIAFYVCIYYSLSICFTIFNKWFLDLWEGGCHFPVICSAGHMSIKLLLTRLVALHPDLDIKPLSPYVVFALVAPIGMAVAFDVMLSNSSLMYINLSMYTIIKATVVVNIYFLAILYGLEVFRLIVTYVNFRCNICLSSSRRFDLLFAISLIVFGLCLAVYSDAVNRSYLGMAMCFAATIVAGR